MDWYIGVLKNYVGFGGRARRQEYWMFTLISVVISIVLAIIDLVIGTSIPGYIYSLAVLLPTLAVTFRRLHDTGRSAWWILLGVIPLIGTIIVIVFLASDSQPGENKFGASPKVAPAHL